MPQTSPPSLPSPLSPSDDSDTKPSTSPISVNQPSSISITDNNFDIEEPSEFCLRWNNYQANLLNVFEQLLEKQEFVDVTLCCEGYSVKAHKIVLSACSPYFQALFNDTPCQYPIVILKDVQWSELKAIVEFMYKGEIHVSQSEIEPLLKLAELLKIRGLSDEQTGGKDVFSQKISDTPSEPRPVKSSIPNKREVEAQKRPKKSDLIASYSKIKKYEPSESVLKRDGKNMLKEELISTGEEENTIDSCQPWLSGPSTSTNDYESKIDVTKLDNNNKNSTMSNYLKLKAPTWTPVQLRDAIQAVVTQELRFTQASIQYNIPKGTLYDNILGKSNRMQILDECGLNEEDEMAILEFCCDISTSPYNRRTKKPLSKIIEYMLNFLHLKFPEDSRFGFRWWWAFCKKYTISSLYYGNNNTVV